jgi:alkaline phosphatase D
MFQKAPDPGRSRLPPSAGLQFFGQIDIDRDTKVLTASLKDMQGAVLFRQSLPAKGR